VRVRLAVLAPVALALLAALPGCGGGGEATTGAATSREAGPGAAQTAPGSEVGNQGGQRDRERPARRESAPTGPPPTSRRALPNEGEKKVAPGVETVERGDNSIQEYGVEGPSAGRAQAALVLQAYLEAGAGGEWARACTYLSAATKRELEELVARSPESEDSKPKGCVETMRTVGSLIRPPGDRGAADIRVLSLRVEGAQAYLVYRDGEGAQSAIAMDREGGRWLLGDLAGNALVLGPGRAR